MSAVDDRKRSRSGKRATSAGLWSLIWILGFGVGGEIQAGSGATFDLGLGGFYSGDRQKLDEITTNSDTTTLDLFLSAAGQIYDPRFLAFRAAVAQALSDIEQRDGSTASRDRLRYDASVRGFSNRPLSFTLDAGRTDTEFEPLSRGALASGITDTLGAGLVLKPRKIPVTAALNYRDSAFEAKEERTLRNEETTSFDFLGSASVGRAASQLELRQRDSDLFGGRLRQRFESGLGQFRYRLGLRGLWQTNLFANRFRSAGEGEPLSDPTQRWTLENRYRYRSARGAQWGISADYQSISPDSGTETTSSRLAGQSLWPLSPTLWFDGELSYLRTDFSEDAVLSQPVVSAGVRWTRETGPWTVGLNPRLSYSDLSADLRQDESSWGGFLGGLAERSHRRGSVALSGEYLYNQVSLAPLGPDDIVAGRNILTGLETQRLLVRARTDYRLNGRLSFSGQLEGETRTREDRNLSIDEQIGRAWFRLQWPRWELGGSFSHLERGGNEIPILSDTGRLSAAWRPRRWLVFEGFVQQDQREVEDAEGSFTFWELGFRLDYGLLSFFARYRGDEVGGDTTPTRTTDRIIIGVRRSFVFAAGDVR